MFRRRCRPGVHYTSVRYGHTHFRHDHGSSRFRRLLLFLHQAKFKYDDALDAFGVHGVGGALGAILTGVFATRNVLGKPDDYGPKGLLEGNFNQVLNQLIGVGAAVLLSVVGTVILLKILDSVMGLRVTQQQELQGLDVSQHGEEGYIFY